MKSFFRSDKRSPEDNEEKDHNLGHTNPVHHRVLCRRRSQRLAPLAAQTMKKTRDCLILAASMMASVCSANLTITYRATVLDVTDGNTITLSNMVSQSVGLDAVAAPKLDQPAGEDAKQFLAELLKGKTVEVAELTDMGQSRGAWVFIGDQCVNVLLVQHGFAWVTEPRVHSKRRHAETELEPALAEAKAKKLGIWAQETPIPPWEWRNKSEKERADNSLSAMSAGLKVGPDAVVVKKLDAAMPADEDKRAEFLWDQFANKAEEVKFSTYGTGDWEKNYSAFADTLVRKARESELQGNSLQKVLELIRASAGGMTYLPVGAYQATLNNDPIWIVVVKWENAGANAPLGHVRIFAYDQKTLRKVGFETCI